MLLIDDQSHPWFVNKHKNYTVYFKGDEAIAQSAVELLQKAPSKDLSHQLNNYFQSIIHYSSGIVETDKYILAWVDHIRSWPLFYTQKNKDFMISNNARRLKKQAKLDKIDQKALTEFSMSGFIGGKNTMISHLYCLQPGEFLLFDKKKSDLKTDRYFKYIPNPSNTEPQNIKIEALDRIFNDITQEIIEKADNRTIWIPLSAGLDSRILLCKLHEHGYKNIQTFTYGPAYNFEALQAKKIAKKLNVPWRMISLSRSKIKKYFNDKKRQDFWNYADNLKAIPCMREFSAISYLYDNKIANQGDIFLNGQSGDYITGGHIFPSYFNDQLIEHKDFTKSIIDKHYSLWNSLKTDNNINVIQEKITDLIQFDCKEKKQPTDRSIQLESWEYDGRQICYVVNGQRIYEFLGFNWEMPLWDKRLVDFCQTLTLEDKKDQFLYKAYLKQYNYKGLFPHKEPFIWRWSMPMIWVVAVAQITGKLCGKLAKENFYNIMRYYGHYANQYAFFDFNIHKKTYKQARNVVSLYVRRWLDEEKLSDGFFKNS